MSRVLENELQDLRQNLMKCFRETLPSKQAKALLVLSVIWLGVLAERDAKTEDDEERRCIKDEFEERRRTVERGIEIIYKQTQRNPEEAVPSPTRTLPRMRRAFAAMWTLFHLLGLR